MRTIIVNLISFASNKNVGTLVFTKRLFRTIEKMALTDYRFIYYAQEGFDFSDFKIGENSSIIRVPKLGNPIKRILYEQTFFRLKLCKADYIFTPYMTIPLIFSRYKQIVTIHDMVPFKLNQKYSFWKLNLIKLEVKLAASLAHKIVTVSHNSLKDICDILNISESKISVIYNFINDDEIIVLGKNNKGLLKQLGLSKPYFITVVTLHPGKNVERLIRAFAKFIKGNPYYQLCIVGNKGWGYTTIFEEVKKYDAENEIIFAGYQKDDALDSLYQHCLGVVYVSLYEGFGIPPLEGFYHNKAAIVSNNSSLPEVVGKAAVLVNPTSDQDITNGFEKFIRNENKLIKEIPAQIKIFNPHKIIQKFLMLFND